MEIIEIVRILVAFCKVLCLLIEMIKDLALQINVKNISKEVCAYIEALSSKDELSQMTEEYRTIP